MPTDTKRPGFELHADPHSLNCHGISKKTSLAKAIGSSLFANTCVPRSPWVFYTRDTSAGRITQGRLHPRQPRKMRVDGARPVRKDDDTNVVNDPP